MHGPKGRSKPTHQLAMLLPIEGGAKIVQEEASVAADEEEALRQLVLSQLATAGLRARQRASGEQE